jgi:uncharacterized protein DUF2752
MQLTWRVPDRRGVDSELLWLGVSISGLFCAAAWLALRLPWPVCWFHQLTGYPCATCGATRAAIAFFHGDVVRSWHWNPLAFLAYSGIAIFDAYAFVVLVTRSRRLRASFSSVEKKILRIALIALLAVNWAYLLAHSSMFNG